MVVLFSVQCEDSFWQSAITTLLEDGLGEWLPEHPTTLVIDEPWGSVFKSDIFRDQVTILVTRNPSVEYWEDLKRLRPNILLAGELSVESLCNAIRIATSRQYLSITPEYASTLTPKEAEALRQLAYIQKNKQIATTLNIEEQSVTNILNNVYTKLQVHGREEAMFKYWGMSDLIKELRNDTES